MAAVESHKLQRQTIRKIIMINLTTTIFNKPLKEVSITDVEEFCKQQIEEGINLDYKVDLNPKKLTKTLAAFANTRGGWIVIGVEDSDAKPVVPVRGVTFTREMSLTITNMVLSNITPSISPICHVCTKNKDGNTLMVIYVPESHEAPHWVNNKSELYIRTAQRTSSGDWERFATSEEWEWLRNKREKSIELRNNLQKETDWLFREYFWEETKNQPHSLIIPKGGSRNDETKNMLNMYISPLYPSDALFTVEETYDLLDKSAVHDYLGIGRQFPIDLQNRNVFASGTNTFGIFDDDNYHFCALHSNGLFSMKETAIFKEKRGAEDLFYADFSQIIARLDQFLRVADSIYKSAGFEGLLSWEIFLDGISWMNMKFPNNTYIRQEYKCPTGDFSWSNDFTARDISDEGHRYKLIQSVIEKLMFAFRLKDFPWNVLENYYSTNGCFTNVTK